MRSRWYPGIIQWPTLIVFMFIMFELLLGPSGARQLRHRPDLGAVVAAHPDHLPVPGSLLVRHLPVCHHQRPRAKVCRQQSPGAEVPEKIRHLDHRRALHLHHLERSCLGRGGKSAWLWRFDADAHNRRGCSLAHSGSAAPSAATFASWAGYRATMPATACCPCAELPRSAQPAPSPPATKAPKKLPAARCLSSPRR